MSVSGNQDLLDISLEKMKYPVDLVQVTEKSTYEEVTITYQALGGEKRKSKEKRPYGYLRLGGRKRDKNKAKAQKKARRLNRGK